MPLRTTRPPTNALVTRAAREPLPGNLPLTSLLRLQRAAGNAAVASRVASVQRCGSIPPDECPCHAEATPVQRAKAEGPVVQRTTVGPILDEYFSPLSSPRVWVMEENDPYTALVRGWRPVIGGQASLLAQLEQDAAGWTARHRTTPGWRPGTTGHDPAAASNTVASPPGTDPATCATAYLPYVIWEAARTKMLGIAGPALPRIETWELHTCSIGSFVLRATLDAIDEAAGTATVNIWMQNEMSRTSFGKFADVAVLSGQATQYMWWHWRVPHRWAPPPRSDGSPG